MLKKPTKKSLIDNGTTIGSAVVGAAVSDGVVGLVPDEYQKWGKPAFALATAIAAASVKGNSTGGKITQGALVGASIKQALDSLREMLAGSMTPQDSTTEVGKFANRVLGLGSADISFTMPPRRVAAPQQPAYVPKTPSQDNATSMDHLVA